MSQTLLKAKEAKDQMLGYALMGNVLAEITTVTVISSGEQLSSLSGLRVSGSTNSITW